ncbi:MAG: hypothetical protein IKP76_00455 [Bacilli bacterium]|nr:hypothetical protein [Bacilli bacterium]
MKKKLFLLLIMILSIFMVPTVWAKEDEPDNGTKRCYYRYYSPEMGYSYMVLQIRGGNDDPTAFITTFNSKSEDGTTDRGNMETAGGWNYDVYVGHKESCPYYAAVDAGGWPLDGFNVRITYTYSEAEMWAKDRMEPDKSHILISESIETDKAKEGAPLYEYDKYIGSDINPGGHYTGITVDTSSSGNYRTCTYTLPEEYRKKGYGYSSAVLIMGPSKRDASVKSAYAIVHKIDGLEAQAFNNQFKENEITDPGNILTTSKNNLSCPYYVYYNTDGTNMFTILNDKSGYETKYIGSDSKPAFLLVSTTIASEKPGYNAATDGVPGGVTDEQNRAYERAKDMGWRNTEGDEDPFSKKDGVVGENFCSQPETIRASKLLGIFVIVSRIIIPFLVIIWGTIDFSKVVTQGNTDSLKKEAQTFGIRVLLGIFIFFIPSIIYAAFTSFVYFNFVSDEYEKCAKCIFHPLDASKCVSDSSSGSTTTKTTTTTAKAGNSIKGAVTTQVTQQLTPGVLLVDPDNQ